MEMWRMYVSFQSHYKIDDFASGGIQSLVSYEVYKNISDPKPIFNLSNNCDTLLLFGY